MYDRLLKLKKSLVVCVIALLFAVLGRSFLIEPLAHRMAPTSVRVTDIVWEGCEQLSADTWDYTYRLPGELSGDEVLCLATYWVSFDVYADDERLFSFDDAKKDKGSSTHWIAVPPSAAGRMLHVVFQGEESRVIMSAEERAYIGNAAMVSLTFVLDKLYALVFAVIVVLMLLLASYFNRLMGKQLNRGLRRGLRYLMLFMLTTGIWIICDSQVMFLFSENVAGNTAASFSAFLLFPMFLLMFVSEMVEHRAKILDVLVVLFRIDYLFVIGCHMTHLISLDYSLISEHLLLVVSIVSVLVCGVRDVKQNGNAQMKKILYGFIGLAAAAVAALVMFYISPATNYAIFYCIGLLSFMLCIIWAAYEKIYHVIGQNADIHAYQRLAFRDVMTDMGNRAAFVEAQKSLPISVPVGFVVLDINDLKYTNDVYGHQAGDEMIRSAAACISGVFCEDCACYRIGGDEFVVIVQNASAGRMNQFLQELDARLLQTQSEQERPWKLRVAYGYAIHQGGDRPDALFKQADDEMYECKRRMKAGCAEVRG